MDYLEFVLSFECVRKPTTRDSFTQKRLEVWSPNLQPSSERKQRKHTLPLNTLCPFPQHCFGNISLLQIKRIALKSKLTPLFSLTTHVKKITAVIVFPSWQKITNRILSKVGLTIPFVPKRRICTFTLHLPTFCCFATWSHIYPHHQPITVQWNSCEMLQQAL